MQIKTKEGIGEPQTLTDLQQYNKRLDRLITLAWIAFIYLIIMTLYIIYNDVINNIVAVCLG